MSDRYIDFSKSFFSWVTKKEQSFGRYGIESRLTFTKGDDASNVSYLLLSGVMAGNVYAQDNLAKDPPFYYQAVFSDNGVFKLFKSHPFSEEDHEGTIDDLFESTDIQIIQRNSNELSNGNSIAHAAREKKRMGASIKYHNETGVEISLEFPINHISINASEGKVFQVETGPILVPGDSVKSGVGSLKLAYIFFNDLSSFEVLEFDWVEDKSGARTRFFSKRTKSKADITLYSL